MPNKNFNSTVRWIHTYLSLFGFSALFFFAFTGITLNHPDLFEGRQKVSKAEGKIEIAWSPKGDITPEARDYLVEYMRKTHNISARLNDFRADDFEFSISFSGPGYNADVFIERPTGSYELSATSAGLIAVLNDLHKGSETGALWPLVIDITAAILLLVSVSGIIMIFYLSRIRSRGIIVAVAGVIFFALLYILIG